MLGQSTSLLPTKLQLIWEVWRYSKWSKDEISRAATTYINDLTVKLTQLVLSDSTDWCYHIALLQSDNSSLLWFPVKLHPDRYWSDPHWETKNTISWQLGFINQGVPIDDHDRQSHHSILHDQPMDPKICKSGIWTLIMSSLTLIKQIFMNFYGLMLTPLTLNEPTWCTAGVNISHLPSNKSYIRELTVHYNNITLNMSKFSCSLTYLLSSSWVTSSASTDSKWSFIFFRQETKARISFFPSTLMSSQQALISTVVSGCWATSALSRMICKIQQRYISLQPKMHTWYI